MTIRFPTRDERQGFPARLYAAFIASPFLTKRALAKASGVNETVISAYLCGRRRIGPRAGERLAKALNVSTRWLLYGVPDSLVPVARSEDTELESVVDARAVGRRLRRLTNDAGSVAAFATVSGCHPDMLGHYLRGSALPRENAERIARAGRTTVDWLLFGIGKPPLLTRLDWIPTYTGRQILLRDPQPEDICIEDIAHGLSSAGRFANQCRVPYFVGQHSVLVSRHVPPEHAVRGLLHDASEAYLGEMTAPLKALIPDYKALERVWSGVIADAANLEAPLENEFVKTADREALATEWRDLAPAAGWADFEQVRGVEPWPERIEPMNPEETKLLFLWQAHELGIDIFHGART